LAQKVDTVSWGVVYVGNTVHLFSKLYRHVPIFRLEIIPLFWYDWLCMYRDGGIRTFM